MTINAIETIYKGYRFRSRLEARWAVAFDMMEWDWRYEAEGYEIETLDYPRRTVRYLPDFYLPKLKFYAEVKGNPSINDIRLLASAAIPHWGLPDEREDTSRLGPRILILGDIPVAGFALHGVMLHWWKGDVYPYAWRPGTDVHGVSGCNDPLAGDNGDFRPVKAAEVIQLLNCRNGLFCESKWDRVMGAADAARTARFEHGDGPIVRSQMSELALVRVLDNERETQRLSFLVAKGDGRSASEQRELERRLRDLSKRVTGP